MLEKSKADRLKDVVSYMKKTKIIKSQKDLCEMLGYNNESTISQFLNGHNPIPKAFVGKIAQYVQGLNEDWVETGNGEMFGEPVVQIAEGTENTNNNQNSNVNNSPNIFGNNNNLGSCSSIEMALQELSAYRLLVESTQKQTENAQAQTMAALNQMKELIEMNKEQFKLFMDLLEKWKEK